jgi:HlyD family secretion protein
MNLKSKKIIFLLVILVVIILIAVRYSQNDDGSIAYRTAKVDRGDISSYITATGTLNPISRVEVGSRVSGTIRQIYVDFNSAVEKDEPLAELDTTPFRAKLEQALADLKKAQADAQLNKTIMDANRELYEKRLISKQEYDDSKVKYSRDTATVEQTKAEVDIAKSNLLNATIRSPIDGIVISKNINVGQSVTTGQNSPPLFVIAEDLSSMNVIAHISESDIGKIEVGQDAVFTVNAYPNEEFSGKLEQIRSEPIVSNNVVTYDVVIRAQNKELKLKPGMTAEVRILVAHRDDTLRVPRAALRFVPPPNALVERNSQEPDGTSVVWIPAGSKKIKPVRINPGISDDNFTEIVGGGLREGEEVIIEATIKGESNSDSLESILPKPIRF